MSQLPTIPREVPESTSFTVCRFDWAMLQLHLKRTTHGCENFVWDVVDVLPTSAVLNYGVGYIISVLLCKLFVVFQTLRRRKHVRYDNRLNAVDHNLFCVTQASTISVSHARFCPKVLTFSRVQILVMLKVWSTQGTSQCRSQCRLPAAR